MKEYIPYSTQTILDDDIESVIKVLKSPLITQGPLTEKFEKAVSSSVGSLDGVSFNSATSALHISCMALGLNEGDMIWTSPNSFVASANCALYCNASVDFVDIDPKSYNICPKKLSEKLIHAEKLNKLPKIIIPVHFAGQSCNMKEIYSLAQKYKIKIIEDASHAIGGNYQGAKIGSCRYSDITVFSFHPVKIITTGEGGMAVSQSQDLIDKMKLLKAHGITRDIKKMYFPLEAKWYYEQIELGYNYRLTEIQAALGLSQLKKIDNFVSKRNEIARNYEHELKSTAVQLPIIDDKNNSSFHLYVIRINEERCGITRDKLFNIFHENKIGVNLHYLPIHLHPCYQELGFKEGDFPNAENYSREAISIPIFPNLKEEQQKFIIKIIKENLQ